MTVQCFIATIIHLKDLNTHFVNTMMLTVVMLTVVMLMVVMIAVVPADKMRYLNLPLYLFSNFLFSSLFTL